MSRARGELKVHLMGIKLTGKWLPSAAFGGAER
jgi:hypothetical protein